MKIQTKFTKELKNYFWTKKSKGKNTAQEAICDCFIAALDALYITLPRVDKPFQAKGQKANKHTIKKRIALNNRINRMIRNFKKKPSNKKLRRGYNRLIRIYNQWLDDWKFRTNCLKKEVFIRDISPICEKYNKMLFIKVKYIVDKIVKTTDDKSIENKLMELSEEFFKTQSVWREKTFLSELEAHLWQYVYEENIKSQKTILGGCYGV